MSLVSVNRSVRQLAMSFGIGIGISFVSTYVFDITFSLLAGLIISIGASVLLGIWAGRIRSRRLWGSLGHVITFAVLYFGLEKIIEVLSGLVT